MIDIADDQAQPASKRRRKDKYAPPTGAEILEKARREARPTTPTERRKLERSGQLSIPGYKDLPHVAAVSSIST